MHNEQNPEFFRKVEICRMMGISLRTLENLVKDRQFPPGVRVGKFCYWTIKAVEDWRRRVFAAQEAWRPI